MSLYICTNIFQGTNCFICLSPSLCVAYLSQVEWLRVKYSMNHKMDHIRALSCMDLLWRSLSLFTRHYQLDCSYAVPVQSSLSAVLLYESMGELSHKAQPAKAKRHSPGLGGTHGTLETNQSCASENLKKAHRHRR